MPGQPDRPVRKPVTVIHFPKVGKPVSVPKRTMTLPEVSGDYTEELVTEPESRILLEEQEAAAPKKERKSGKRRKTAEIPAQEPKGNYSLTPQEASSLASMGHQLFELGASRKPARCSSG
jgi:hypothetical protein